MNDQIFTSKNANITKKAVRKWALDWAKRFKEVRRSVVKAGDDFEGVIKGLDVETPSYRLFRNATRKLKRESRNAAVYSKRVVKLIDDEIKHYTKIAEGLTPKK